MNESPSVQETTIVSGAAGAGVAERQRRRPWKWGLSLAMVVSIALITGFMLGQSLPSGRAEDKEEAVPSFSVILSIGIPHTLLSSATRLNMYDSVFTCYKRI